MDSFVKNFTPALAPELLWKHNFFELYPFDGGGAFINHTILGSVDDRVIAERIINGEALDDYGSLTELDFCKYECWRTIEKSCWINRMYFIVPLARYAAQTGNRQIAEYVKDVILRFQRLYPPPADKDAVCKLERDVKIARDRDYNSGANLDAAIPYQWFDFQPASRVLHVLHAVWFLRDMDILSDEEYALIDDFVAENVRVIYEGEHYFYDLQIGNHQALRALAMLTAGVAFAGDPRADEWLAEGIKGCEYHILNDFLPDGMGCDLSPSYHFFECWICRDAAIYLARQGKAFSAAAMERLQKAFRICSLFKLPNGKTPVISDGYPLDMEVFFRTLPDLPELTDCSQKLSDAMMAVFKTARTFGLFDCSPLLAKYAHFHAGKQGVTLWFGGKAFVEEGGCCNYDDPKFPVFFKTAHAHASLLIDGQGDSVLSGVYCWEQAPECQLADWQNGKIFSVMHTPVWPDTRWRREVEFAEGCAVIADKLESVNGKPWTFRYPLAAEVKVEITADGAILTNDGVQVKMSSPLPVREVESLIVRDFQIVPTIALEIAGRDDAEISVSFELLSD